MASVDEAALAQGLEDVKKLFESDIPLARCEKLQALVAQLTLEKNGLKEQLETSEEKSADKIEGFRLKTESLYNTLAELESRNELLESRMVESAARQESEHAEFSERLDGEMSTLRASLQHAEERLHVVREFEEDELANAARRAELEAKIAADEEDHGAQLSAIERERVKEKEMIKREMQREMGDAARSLQETTKDQLDETTKRTLQKNETMAAELQYQSMETEKLIAQNAKLAVEVKTLRAELATQQQLQHEFATRSHRSQKLVTKLHEKMQSREAEGVIEAARLRAGGDEALKERVAELERLLDAGARESETLTAEVRSYRASAARAAKRTSRSSSRRTPSRTPRGGSTAPLLTSMTSMTRDSAGLGSLGLAPLTPLVFDDARSIGVGSSVSTMLPSSSAAAAAATTSSTRSRELTRLHNSTTMLFLLALEDAKRELAERGDSSSTSDVPSFAGFASAVAPPSMLDMSAAERVELLEVLLQRLNAAGLSLAAPETGERTKGLTLPALT